MAEKIIPAEILQQRSDTIILGMRRMVKAGADPKFLRYLEDDSPRKHRDLIQVYLGIKPCATQLIDVFDFYSVGDDLDDMGYLEYFPQEKDTGVKVSVHGYSCSVWNPDLVTEVLEEHNDLKAMVHVSPADHKGFGKFIDSLYFGKKREDFVLHGIILGYPRIAAEMFTDYNGLATSTAQKLWRTAVTRGIIPQTQAPNPFLWDLNDEGGIQEQAIRDEFVRLARRIGYPNTDLVNYVQGLRMADVPGWQFLTSGDATLPQEQRIRDQFAASGFDAKFARFLEGLNR